jgi:type IV pilus assembly protein PilY1
MKRLLPAAILAALALSLPRAAAADYLYSVLPAQRQPRILILVDNSSAFSDGELADVQAELKSLIPRLDGISIWLGRFGKLGTTDRESCSHDVTGSLVDTSRPTIEAEIDAMLSGGNSPIGSALQAAKDGLKAIAKDDKGSDCRPYFVLLITGGKATPCSSGDDTDNKVLDAITSLRDVTGGGVHHLDIRTFVIRYGDDLLDGDWDRTDLAEVRHWNTAARKGGTALTADGFCAHEKHAACTAGGAMYALNRSGLRSHLDRVFSHLLYGEYSALAPVIGTAPFEDHEVGRVARNFMAYTSFRMPGNEGHLYGVRLFTEETPLSGQWVFTNFNDLKLDSCGATGNPCAFDAGRKLRDKVGKRTIFTATPKAPITTQESSKLAAVTLPLNPERVLLSSDADGNGRLKQAWSEYKKLVTSAGLDGALPANTAELDLESGTGPEYRTRILRWLQGESRSWPLGDLYHGGATVIGAAGFSYRTRGYPVFAEQVKNRPTMIYVGANDGMIHAFHATPKLQYQKDDKTITATWEAGEEAWAYLPVNMLARAASAILDGENRFFSQDLSCRVDDVLLEDMSEDCGKKGTDKYCGWRTVLVCGQGWGGSWYVALDVSDPLNPVPLWESTYAGDKGMGRTWNVPGVALLNDDGMPRWVAIVGNGYNADMGCMGETCGPAEKYRLLNLPFDGTFPQHGDGAGDEKSGRVFLIDMATGEFLDALDSQEGEDETSGPVVADTPVVDSNFDGWSDSAYAGNWESQIDQILFEEDATHGLKFSICQTVGKFSGSTNKAITSRPSALPSTSLEDTVHLFVGSGVDGGGIYPDEQFSSGNQYKFAVFDVGGKSCKRSRTSSLCTKGSTTLTNIFNDGHRLVGSPLFVLRKNGERWLTFTSWLPPSTNQPCATSEAILRCLETSRGETCTPCGDLDGDGVADESTKLDTGGRQPTSPTSADGQLYVTTPYGPVRVNNQSGTTGGVSGGEPDPNQGAPSSTVILGWREVFD